jgi:hypothetical protein
VPTDKGYRFFVDSLLRRGTAGTEDETVVELQRRLIDDRERDPRRSLPPRQVLSSIHAPRGPRQHTAGAVASRARSG